MSVGGIVGDVYPFGAGIAHQRRGGRGFGHLIVEVSGCGTGRCSCRVGRTLEHVRLRAVLPESCGQDCFADAVREDLTSGTVNLQRIVVGFIRKSNDVLIAFSVIGHGTAIAGHAGDVRSGYGESAAGLPGNGRPTAACVLGPGIGSAAGNRRRAVISCNLNGQRALAVDEHRSAGRIDQNTTAF